jgi:hypothetical protein
MKTHDILPPPTTSGPSDADVRERAYYLWLERGCPPNRDQEMWFAAQVLLHDETNLRLRNLPPTAQVRQENQKMRLDNRSQARDARPAVAQTGAPQRRRSRQAQN